MSHDPARHLPLNPRVFAILAALSDGAVHGYAVKRAVEEHSGGSLTLDPGSLYRHLSRLLEEGLVVEVPRPPGTDGDDPRRRYYELTAEGREVLAAEARRLEALMDGAGLLGRGRRA